MEDRAARKDMRIGYIAQQLCQLFPGGAGKQIMAAGSFHQFLIMFRERVYRTGDQRILRTHDPVLDRVFFRICHTLILRLSEQSFQNSGRIKPVCTDRDHRQPADLIQQQFVSDKSFYESILDIDGPVCDVICCLKDKCQRIAASFSSGRFLDPLKQILLSSIVSHFLNPDIIRIRIYLE